MTESPRRLTRAARRASWPTLFYFPPHGRSLSGGADLFRAIGASPTLLRIAREAEASLGAREGNRGPGEAFEKAFLARLDADAQAGVLADVLAAFPGGRIPDAGDLLDLVWEPAGTGGRSTYDVIVKSTYTSGAVRRDWVNIKRTSGTHKAASEATALSAFLRVALGHDLTTSARLNIPRTLLRWFAGEEKVQASDYFILEAEVDDEGTVVTLHAQGLLASVRDDGGPAYALHSNRDVVKYHRSSDQLPDDFDVNRQLPRALAREVSPDAFRLALLTFTAGESDRVARRTARALLAADDDALRAAARAVVKNLPKP